MQHTNMKTTTDAQKELINSFELFDSWMEKYEFLIDLGKSLPEFLEEYKKEQYKVKGCQSNVWIYHEYDNNLISFSATSDSAIVSGLIYLLLTIYNNHTPKEIVNIKPDFIESIGLDNHLSPTRKNGLYAMLQAINNIANCYLISSRS